MKNAGVTALAVIILYALQTSLLPLIAYHGVTTDLLLLFVTSTAFLKGARVGALSGFAVGLLQDLASGTFLGMNAFTRLLLGFCIAHRGAGACYGHPGNAVEFAAHIFRL